MKKKSKEKMQKWVKIPEKTMTSWLGDFIVSSMVLKGYEITGKLPKRIRLPKKCIKELPDGSGLLSFEIN